MPKVAKIAARLVTEMVLTHPPKLLYFFTVSQIPSSYFLAAPTNKSSYEAFITAPVPKVRFYFYPQELKRIWWVTLVALDCDLFEDRNFLASFYIPSVSDSASTQNLFHY